ncbi:MAG: outer membrane beta-barrel protein [Proteobacteria bacterium]|nr:outer membrane beta-barrel protein [Pseudomonadota bacterium]
MRATLVALTALALGQRAWAQSHPGGFSASAEAGIVVPVGSEGETAGTGFFVAPRLAYELSSGIAPTLGLSYSRWGSTYGPRWELSALPGVRWNIGTRSSVRARLRPWIQGSVGWGQLDNHNNRGRGRVDSGPRFEAGFGIEYAISRYLRIAGELMLNRLQGGGELDFNTTWFSAGVALTYAP